MEEDRISVGGYQSDGAAFWDEEDYGTPHNQTNRLNSPDGSTCEFFNNTPINVAKIIAHAQNQIPKGSRSEQKNISPEGGESSGLSSGERVNTRVEDATGHEDTGRPHDRSVAVTSSNFHGGRITQSAPAKHTRNSNDIVPSSCDRYGDGDKSRYKDGWKRYRDQSVNTEEVAGLFPSNAGTLNQQNEDMLPTPFALDENMCASFAQSSIPEGSLEYYFQDVCYLGVSMYRREEYEPPGFLTKAYNMAVYLVFTSCAILQIFALIKSEAIKAAVKGDLESCVRFGYSLVRLLNRGFFISLVTFSSEKISTMLLHNRMLRQFDSGSFKKERFSRLAAHCLVAISVIVSSAAAIFNYVSLKNWSFEEALRFRSYQMSKVLHIWSAKFYKNATDTISVDIFETNISPSHIVMGTAETILDFCETLQGEIIRDILLLAALQLLLGWRKFNQRIQPMLLIHPNKADENEVEDCLRHYKAMRKSNASTNDALSSVLNFVLIQNLLLFAYFFVQIFSYPEINMKTMHLAVNCLKAAVTFYIALQVHWMNDNVSNWLRMMSTYKKQNKVEEILGMTVDAALDDLRESPVGFGRDYFLINVSFLAGFFAALTSIITFLVESDNQNCDCSQCP